ncbi:MAG: sulfur carrier protein ThiS [Xanthomonadaceae bacterium]|nr:sulfur carrier protein ThiS [Xanthomonadaceae bacterium]MDE3072896.1 sulfur carrier protein ThiS [Pseudomonadota bacterium]
MQIIVNGDARDVDAGTLAQALERLDYAAAVVATAVNGHFVPALARASTALCDGDRVEIVAPMQGG